MINVTAQKLASLIYLVIGVVGIAIASLFIAEAQQNRQLLDDNHQLLTDTIKKTMLSQLTARLDTYPQSTKSLEQQWLTLAKDFYFFENNQQGYPYLFKGKASQKLSDKWQQFEQFDPSLSTAEYERAQALRGLKSAIMSKQHTLITKRSQHYFDLVANFQLSAISEVISALTFLTLDSENQWNDTLVQQMLISGSSMFRPVVYYLYLDNVTFTKADNDKIQQITLRLLEQSNINTRWLTTNTELMTSSKAPIFDSAQSNYSLLTESYIGVVLEGNIRLVVPYVLTNAVDLAVKELKLQGVLAANDELNLSNESKAKSLTELNFVIDKPSWQKLAQQQQWFFISKSVLLIVFIAALTVVTRLLINQQKKKQSYIAMREQFINLVSHELKTPLAAIRVMAETADKRSNKGLSLKDYPERMINEVDRLWLMVDNLLSMNRLKSNEVKLTIQSVSLHNVVAYSFEKHNEYSAKPAKLINNISPDITLEVDELLFELVISNLISNAIKYNDKADITLEFFYDPASKVLTLVDNSCGIEHKQWRQVFDEFQRLPQQKAISGNGIGLALCKLILRQHQADISINQSSEKGTTWHITF